jgi:hypothetical protein
MALADIRAAVKARIEAVPDVGKVWPYEPHVTRTEDRETYFVSHNEIRAWTITRESTQEMDTGPRTHDDAMAAVNLATHGLVLRHYRSMNGHAASEEAFQDAIEAVRDVLRYEERSLLGLPSVHTCGPPSVRIAEARMLGIAGAGDALVHYAEVYLPVVESVSPPWP